MRHSIVQHTVGSVNKFLLDNPMIVSLGSGSHYSEWSKLIIYSWFVVLSSFDDVFVLTVLYWLTMLGDMFELTQIIRLSNWRRRPFLLLRWLCNRCCSCSCFRCWLSCGLRNSGCCLLKCHWPQFQLSIESVAKLADSIDSWNRGQWHFHTSTNSTSNCGSPTITNT